jgi:hypothetical protein
LVWFILRGESGGGLTFKKKKKKKKYYRSPSYPSILLLSSLLT